MSKENGSELVEVNQTVAISAEDLKHIRDFFTHFNITMPETLTKSLDSFQVEASWQNQERIKVELAAAMYEIDHPIFKDELFKAVRTNSERIVFDARFTQQVESKLTPSEE